MPEDFSVDIDPYRLDEEWVKQPKLYHVYAEKAADARQALDDAKNELEVVRASLYKEISAFPDKFGLSKTTEAAINNAMTVSDEYQQATQAVINAKHTVAVVEAAVQALDQRKKALEKLVDLHIADYYSKPRATKGEAAEYISESTRRPVSGISRKRRKK